MAGFGGSRWGQGAWGDSEDFVRPVLEVFVDDTCLVTDESEYAIPLRVAHATALSLFTVRVRFSNEIDITFPPLSDPANYTIPGLIVTSVTISSADTVILSTTPAQSNLVYVVTAAQGRSTNGDLLGPDNSAAFLGFVLIPSFIAGAISATQVDLIFSTEMTPDAAFTSIGSYIIRGGPGGVAIPILSATISGGIPIRRVTLRLVTPLQSMETYAAVVSSAVTSILGQIVSPDTYLFKWADMSRPVHGAPLEIPIRAFSGEVESGILGNPAGQVFFSPAYEAVGATSTIELESVSVCTRAFDQYEFPSLPDPPSLYTFGPGVSSVLSAGFILWAPAEKLGLFKSKLSNFGQEDVLPKIYDSSTGNLESPIGDTPAIATLRETIDITRASFLNDLRWRTFPGTGATVFMTADNMTPIGPGPTTIRALSRPRAEVRDPHDFIDLLDEVDVIIPKFEDAISVTDSVDVEVYAFFSVLVSDVISLGDQATSAMIKVVSHSDAISVSDQVIRSATKGVVVSDSVSLVDGASASKEYVALVSDSVALSDQVSIECLILVSDTLSVTDEVTIESGMDPGALYSALQTIFGALLTGVWVGEDLIVDGSNNITSWPERNNTGTLTNAHATNRFTTRTVNGRLWMYTSVEAGKSLVSPARTGDSVYMVMVSMPPLPFTDYKLALGSNIYQVLAGASGTSTLYSSQSTLRYVDGVLTDTVSSGIHLIEATTGANTSFFVGGLEASYPGYPGRDWTADIGCVVVLSSAPTSQQRADALTLLKTYYNVP
jgi:hypothetical protein